MQLGTRWAKVVLSSHEATLLGCNQDPSSMWGDVESGILKYSFI